MSLLIPLGLLALLSIAVLIAIYLIKPNYQQKSVSSTFVWELSLKYKKKRIPINRLRNLLLILCQILILTAGAMIIAKPVHFTKIKTDNPEVIAIIDSSASMRTESEGETRYMRAVKGALRLSDDIFKRDGIFSAITADHAPSFVEYTPEEDAAIFTVKRVEKDNASNVQDALNALIDGDGNTCPYGISDVSGAIKLCSEVISENPDAVVYLYTDAEYAYVPPGVELVNVANDGEWNAAILSAEAELEDNYYAFFVDVASYGKDIALDVTMSVYGANATSRNPDGYTFTYVMNVGCNGGKPQRLIFRNESGEHGDDENAENTYVYPITDTERVASYKYIYIQIDAKDNFSDDDEFFIYGGEKEAIKVLYASFIDGESGINIFFTGQLSVLRDKLRNSWNIQITEVRDNLIRVDEQGKVYIGRDKTPVSFDYYIFEHTMPANLPSDGVVFLVDPDKLPTSSGLRVDSETTLGTTGEVYLSEDETHPITANLAPEKVFVTKYRNISVLDPNYKTLFTYNGAPLLMIKETQDSKVVVMSFSVHFSNIARRYDFSLLLTNMFRYFFPPTVNANAFEVNENIALNSRGDNLTVSFGNWKEEFKEFPATLTVTKKGTYTLTQKPFGREEPVVESIYVTIPVDECNINKKKDAVEDPRSKQANDNYYDDLLLYFAIALVSLLFIEWLLQARETM